MKHIETLPVHGFKWGKVGIGSLSGFESLIMFHLTKTRHKTNKREQFGIDLHTSARDEERMKVEIDPINHYGHGSTLFYP